MTENLDKMLELLANMNDLGAIAERTRKALAEEVTELRLAAAGQRELPGIGESPAGERGLLERIDELERERERQAGQIARLVRENEELRRQVASGRLPVAPGQAAD